MMASHRIAFLVIVALAKPTIQFPFRTFSQTINQRAQKCRSVPSFQFSDHYQGSLPMRNFASKSSAPDEVDWAESLPREIEAVRFKIEAVIIKVEAVEIKVEAVEICLRKNNTEITHSTNIHVQTYKSLTKPRLLKEREQLLKEEEHLQDFKNKLLDENNKLLDMNNKLLELLILLVKEKNLLRSEGKGNATVAISPSLYDYCFSILCPVEYPYALRQ